MKDYRLYKPFSVFSLISVLSSYIGILASLCTHFDEESPDRLRTAVKELSRYLNQQNEMLNE